MSVACRLDEQVAQLWHQAALRPQELSGEFIRSLRAEGVCPGDPALVTELARAVDRVDPTPVRRWTDPREFAWPVCDTVDSAMGWQEPHDEDVVAGEPEVVDALRAIASAVLAAPAAAWWTRPIHLESLRYTSRYDEQDPPEPPVLIGAKGRLMAWRQQHLADEVRDRRERPADPAAPYSGFWWSTPSSMYATPTTGTLDGVGSVNLLWEEDSFDQDRAMVWPLRTTRPPRVYEIDGPEAWARLVREYPLDATWSRRHDWFRVTGRDGVWHLPDYVAVSRDWDAIHLSVAGYLTTATYAVAVSDEAATVLTGWDPDQTWWLSDILEVSGAPQRWETRGDGDAALSWRRA